MSHWLVGLASLVQKVVTENKDDWLHPATEGAMKSAKRATVNTDGDLVSHEPTEPSGGSLPCPTWSGRRRREVVH